MKRSILPLATSIAALLTLEAHAQITWLNPAVDGDWNNAANWAGGNVPNLNTEQAVFDQSNITNVNLLTALTIQKLTFNATAPAYSLTGVALTIDANTTATAADGILVTAGAGVVTINNAVTLNDSNGTAIAPQINVGAGATLNLSGTLSSTGNRNLPFNGPGVLNLFGQVVAGTGQIQHTGAGGTINLFVNPTSTGQIRSFSNNGSMNLAVSLNKALGLGVTGGLTHVGRIFLTGDGMVSSGAVTQGGGGDAGTHTLDVTFGTNIPGTGTATQSGAFTLSPLTGGRTGVTGITRLDVGEDDTLNLTGIVSGSSTGYSAPQFIKQGLGTAFLSAANTYTVPTRVAAGTLIVTPLQTGNSAMTVDDGATLTVRLATAGTMLNTSALTTGSATGATLRLETFGLGAPTAPVINTTTLTTAGTTTIHLVASGLTTATGVPLIDYTGTIGGAGIAGLSLALPFRVAGTLVDNVAATRVDADLVVESPRWNGNIAGGIWDIDDGSNTVGTLNWRTLTSNTATGYVQAPIGTDSVIFDDAATGTTDVVLNTNVSPLGITFNNSTKNYTLSGTGTISGSGDVIKNGTGTVTFLNATSHDYTGATRINNGLVQVGDGVTFGAGTLGTGPVVLAGSGVLSLNHPEDFTFPNATSGTGTVTKPGATNVTLTGAVTHTGATNVPDGVLTLSPAVAYNFNSAITGAAMLQKFGATVALTADNAATHTGLTFINAGALQIGNGAVGNPVGSNGLSGTPGSGEININSGATLALNRNDTTLVIPNTISGGGGITVNGAFGSIVTLTADNFFGGGVNVTGGGIRIPKAAALGTGTKTITLNNGTAGRPSLRLDGSSGDITLPANMSFQTSSADPTNPAIVNEAGNNVIAGNFTLTAGGGDTRIRVDAGTLRLTGNIAPNTTLRNVILDGAANGTFTGVYSNGGQTGTNAPGLRKDGVGTWTLTGANVYAGTTVINAGVLLTTTAQTGTASVTVNPAATFGVRKAAAAGVFTTPILNLGNGGAGTLQLDLAGFPNPTVAPVNAAAFTVGAGSAINLRGGSLSIGAFPAVSYAGAIGGAGFAGLSLVVQSPRIAASLVDNAGGLSVDINVTAVNYPRWRGDLGTTWDIDNGTGTGTANWREQTSGNVTRYRQDAPDTDSVLFDDTATGTIVDLSSTLTPNGVVVNNSTVPLFTFGGAGKLSGNASLTKSGTGTLAIVNTTPNDYTGPTTINGGTVQIGDGITAGAGSLGSGGIVNNGTLVLNLPEDFTQAGALSGTGTLTKQNANIATFTTAAAFDGPIGIAAGALAFSGGGSLSGAITGPGALNVNAGALNLTGADNNTYGGGTTIFGGDLRLNKAAGNAVGGDITIFGAGRLIILGNEQIANTATITFIGTSTDSTAGSTGTETVANVIANAASPAGQFLMGNNFNVTGTATLNNGILGVRSGQTATLNALNMTGGILRIAGGSAASFLNIGAGGITASGGEIQVKFSTTDFDATLNLGGDFVATGDVIITNANYAGASLNIINLVGGPRTFDIADATTTTIAPDFGDGTLIKTGDGTLALNGTLGTTGAFTLNANDGTTTIANSQTLAALNIGAGATVTLLEDFTPAPAGGLADELEFVGAEPADEFGAAISASELETGGQAAAVPEPGALGLLAAGVLGMLSRSRRRL